LQLLDFGAEAAEVELETSHAAIGQRNGNRDTDAESVRLRKASMGWRGTYAWKY
jgi:hypothetical protein